MPIVLNLAGVQASQALTPVPAGQYVVAVNSVKMKTASTGTPMLEWIFAVEEGPYAGRRLFTNTVVGKQDAMWRVKDFLLALGFAPEELEGAVELEPEQLIGLTATAVVNVREYNGENRNEIKRLIANPDENDGGMPKWSEDTETEEDEGAPTKAAPVSAEAAAAAEVQREAEADEDEDEEEDVDAVLAELAGPYMIPPTVKISPKARTLAEEYEVPLDQIKPSGPKGTYSVADIQAWLDAAE